MGGMARSVWNGPPAELAKILSKFASTPSICTYGDESSVTLKAKLIKGEKGVGANHNLLHALRGLQTNLSFAKLAMVQALRIVHKKTKMREDVAGTKGWASSMSPAEVEDWVEVIQRRTRNCCRVVSQGAKKTPSAEWVTNLPWMTKQAIEQSASHGQQREPSVVIDDTIEASQPKRRRLVTKVSDEARDKESQYEVKLQTEVCLPLRISAGGKEEMGLSINILSGQKDNDIVIACWPDGFSAPLPDWTVGEYLKLVGTGGKRSGAMFSTTHVKTCHEITVAQRSDRDMLMSIYEQGKQICMTKVPYWGDVVDNKTLPDNHPSVQGAFTFMKELAEAFARDEVARDELKEERDRRLVRLGKGKAKITKQPAADSRTNATTSESTAASSTTTRGDLLAEPASAAHDESSNRGSTQACEDAAGTLVSNDAVEANICAKHFVMDTRNDDDTGALSGFSMEHPPTHSVSEYADVVFTRCSE